MRFQAVQSQMGPLAAALFAIAFSLWLVSSSLKAEPATTEELEQEYGSEIRPMLARYCHKCHGAGETIEADLNFAALSTWADVNRHVDSWQKVKEMIDGGLMPPE